MEQGAILIAFNEEGCSAPGNTYAWIRLAG
jgi:hypothetical protein